MINLPQEYLDRMKTLLGDDFESYLNSLGEKPKKSFFINTNKISTEKFLKIFPYKTEPLNFSNNAFLLCQDIKIGKTPYHHSGMIYMQEVSAMYPALNLPIVDGDLVLDLCSAPGGKTIQIAKNGNCVVVANEINNERVRVLSSNIERMGLNNVVVINNNPLELENEFEGLFDKIVVDAPCSGEGMFRKDDDAILNWSKENVKSCALRQYEILKSAHKMLKSNGMIIYSTCTFSIEEDEAVVDKFVNEFGYQILPLSCNVGAVDGVKLKSNTNLTKRLYPHLTSGEGQFMALLQKPCCEQKIKNSKKLAKNIEKINKNNKKYAEFYAFTEKHIQLDETLKEEFCNKIYSYGNFLYYSPMPEILSKNVNFCNLGVRLGNIEKGRFEPYHNLFTTFGKYFVNKIDLSLDETEKFLKGETINVQSINGWHSVAFEGVCFAGGKVVNGVLKNHYPKGLRNF